MASPFPFPLVYNSCPVGMNFFEPATPLVGGIWDATKWTVNNGVTFLSDGIQVNGGYGSQVPGSGSTKFYASGFSAVGTTVYGRGSFLYAKNSNPDFNIGLLSIGSGSFGPAYVINVSQFNNHVRIVFNNGYDGSAALQGAYSLTNGSMDPYILEYLYEVTGANAATISYWLWNSTMTTLLETNTYSGTGIQDSISVGFKQEDAFATSKLLDFWVYGPSIPGTPCGPSFYTKFISRKTQGLSPLYTELVDVSDFSNLTSASDYQRIFSITNDRTSATEIITTTSAASRHKFQGLHGDTFSISMSALI